MTSSSSGSTDDEVDFNVFRKEYESEEHWNLRKSFLIHHWDRIDNEEEIMCCAQLFVNIEFLGCRYAKEVMDKISSMSNEVPEIKKYRASRRDKLKRTFVTAKDAVQAKYTKSAPNFIPQQIKDTQNSSTKPFKIDINYRMNKNNDGWSKTDKIEWNIYEQESNMGKVNPSIKLSESQKVKKLRSLLRDVIVFESGEENDLNYCLNKTSACMRKIGKLEVKFDADSSKYFYIFNGQIVAEGVGDSKKNAKKAADEDFIKTLRENCYTIRSKLKFYSGEDVITRNNNKAVKPDTNQIQEDNLGFKLLAKLGWKGGSLGTNGTGIIDPINLEIKIGKFGLGAENDRFDQKYFRNLLQNFKQNQVEYDLIFSSEFSKEERAQIHQIAAQLNLRTKSYGKNTSRHLVISTRISPQVLREKLIEGDEYLREKYELVPPPFVKTVKPRII